jgi:hypothetical protein
MASMRPRVRISHEDRVLEFELEGIDDAPAEGVMGFEWLAGDAGPTTLHFSDARNSSSMMPRLDILLPSGPPGYRVRLWLICVSCNAKAIEVWTDGDSRRRATVPACDADPALPDLCEIPVTIPLGRADDEYRDVSLRFVRSEHSHFSVGRISVVLKLELCNDEPTTLVPPSAASNLEERVMAMLEKGFRDLNFKVDSINARLDRHETMLAALYHGRGHSAVS